MNNVAAPAAIPPTEVDQKIDPSIATAITTGGEHSHEASGSAAPAYTTAPGTGEASSGAVSAGAEKSGELPPTTTTTTTTIITTTTGPNDGSPTSPIPGTAPTSPIVGDASTASGIAPGSNLTAAAMPANAGSTTNGSIASPVSADQPTSAITNGSAVPGAVNGTNGVNGTQDSTTHPAVPAAAAAGAVGAAGGAAAAHHAGQEKAQPEMAMKPKEAKQYTKLLKKEAKNDEKDLAKAIKDAQNLEKPLRKANKAEKQSEKRHQSAVHDEHKASKTFNKYKLEYEKAQAALQKAVDELDIKKRHTSATQEAFDKAKKRIDELRDSKVANDKDRARRQASITTTH